MKNLKKGLAVAMSLAMIATVMPTMNVSAATPGATGTVCATIETDGATLDASACGKLVYLELEGKTMSDYTMEDKKLVVTADGAKVDYFTAINTLKTALMDYQAGAGIAETREIKTWLDAVAAIDSMFAGSLVATADTETDTAVRAFLGIVNTARTNMGNSLDKGAATTWNKAGFDSTEAGTSSTTPDTADLIHTSEIVGVENLKAAKAALKSMNEFVAKGYNELMTSTMQWEFEDVRYALEEVITAKTGDTKPADLAGFVTSWEKVLKADLTGDKAALGLTAAEQGYTGLAAGDTGINLASKSAINSRINKIKNHDLYVSFKEEEAVIAIIEAYEELIDAVDGNRDLTKTDAYKAYVNEKTDDANATPKVAVKGMTMDDTTQLTGSKAIAAIAADIDNEQFEALKTYKEDVLDEILTMSTRKIGNYHIAELAWSKTISTTIQNTITNNLPDEIYALIDTKEGLFGYDVIVEHMADFNEALDAATKDIEKITPANIKAADKAKLEAAEDAIYELTNERKGAFVGNLTDKEERSLRAAERKIENLREAYDNLGIASTTGWYDKGNGNWGYNNEDGTPATKWVAAGKLWYYVKGGDMLRNSWVAQDSTGKVWYYVNNAGEMVVSTTIDGYAINANGEWHK